MDACLETKTDYIDTANYEPEDTTDPEWKAVYEKRCKDLGFTAYFDYSWQWAYKEKFEKQVSQHFWVQALTRVLQAYLQHMRSSIILMKSIIQIFSTATAATTAIRLQQTLTLKSIFVRYLQTARIGKTASGLKPNLWRLRECITLTVWAKGYVPASPRGNRVTRKNIPNVKRIRFFMTFGQSYLTHMQCLENVGMLSTEPVMYEGREIVPIQFLKALLPDPASLGPRTKGKTNIGCIFTGVKDGKEKTIYIYNMCDHQECYKEVGSQAVSYTTGVPAMIGASLVLSGQWKKPGVYNVEEFDPDPYMEALNKFGLPWVVDENPVTVE